MSINQNISLTDRAYFAIEEAIITLKFAPGSVITEVDLSQFTGIGRTPIREAVQRLAREQLLRVLPKRGLLIAHLDLLGEMKLLDLRREVEGLVCRSAAKLANREQKQEFSILAQEFKIDASTNDDLAFSRHDRAFGELCVKAAQNEYAAEAMKLFVGLSRRSWYFHQQRGADLASMALRHSDLAAAISTGDVEQTQKTFTSLLNQVESVITKTLRNI